MVNICHPDEACSKQIQNVNELFNEANEMTEAESKFGPVKGIKKLLDRLLGKN